MTYTPHMNSLTPQACAYKIDQREIERVLKRLLAGQSGGVKSTQDTALPLNVTTTEPKAELNRGQFEFAFRIARITQNHAARHKAKLCWKHRSVGLLRRLALVVMVATVLTVQYI